MYPYAAMLTTQASTLMPGGHLDDPAHHNPTVKSVIATANGRSCSATGAVAALAVRLRAHSPARPESR